MTKIILSCLTCRQTEDNTGADEAELRIWADNNYISDSCCFSFKVDAPEL